MGSPFIHNEHGVWCPCCGNLLDTEDTDFELCSTWGYPDDIEAMAHYHCEEEVNSA